MAEPDPAASRYFAMNLMRLIGLAHVLAGAMAIAGTIAIPAFTGYALFVIGLTVFFFAPIAMAKAWKSRDK